MLLKKKSGGDLILSFESLTVSSSFLHPILLSASACLHPASLGFHHACFGHYITIIELLVQEKQEMEEKRKSGKNDR